MNPIRIFACESQPIAVEGLLKVFCAHEEFEFLGAAASGKEATARILELKPDVVLVDHAGGLRAVFQFLTELKAAAPAAKPVLWTMELSETETFRALQMGARGIVRRTLPVTTLLDCLRSVGRGSIWVENSISDQVTSYLNRKANVRLTPREREIVALVARGMKNKQVAEALQITPGTVKVHLMHIFEKTGVKDRFELALQGPRLLGNGSNSEAPTEGVGAA